MISVPIQVLGPALLRRGIEEILGSFPWVRVLVAGAMPAEAPVVMLFVGSGWERDLERFRAEPVGSQCPRLILLTEGEYMDQDHARGLGMESFVCADSPSACLEQALQSGASAGARRMPSMETSSPGAVHSPLSGSARQSTPAILWATLSAREREVAEFAVEGLTNEQIATRLYLSLATVKFHMGRIFGKLRIPRRTRLSAILIAARAGADTTTTAAIPGNALSTPGIQRYERGTSPTRR